MVFFSSKYKKIVLGIFAIMLGYALCGQKTFESVLAEASMEVYENPDRAIRKGLKIYRSPESGVKNKVNALMLVSTGYSSKRNYEKSLEYAMMAKDYFDRLDDKALKISILNKIGIQYQQMNIYVQAIEYLNRAMELSEHFPSDSLASLLGYNYAARGFIYREQMSCGIALDYFNKSIEQYKKIEETPGGKANLSILVYNKGNCFIALSKIDSAKVSFKSSMEYARAVGANSLIAFAQKGLAEVRTLQGKYNASIAILEKALEISSQVGDLVLNKELYNAMANNYLALNKWEEYALFHKKFLSERQKIEQTERSTINRSIKNLLKKNSQKVASLNVFYKIIDVVLLCAIFLGMFFVFFQWRKSRKRIKTIERKLRGTKNGP